MHNKRQHTAPSVLDSLITGVCKMSASGRSETAKGPWLSSKALED